MSFNDLMQKFSGSSSEPLELPPESKNGSLDSFIDRFAYAGTTESYWFYNHTVELKYMPDPEHKYYRVAELRNLLSVWGVTDTTHIINAAERLVPWAAKVTIAKLLRIIPTETGEDGTIRIKPLTLEEFTTLALEAKKAHREHLEDAGDIGHMAHKCLEESILYALKNDPEKIVRQLINLPQDERAVNAANSAKAWMDAHNVRWIETETKVYSLEHNVAGTTDGMAICDSCSDKACCAEEFKDHLSIVDWKSSNYLNVSFLYQVAFYKHAKQEEFGLDIKDCWINRLGKSEEEAGKFEAWFVPDKDFAEDIAGFLSCLRLTQLVKAAEERMKLQKGVSRTIRKEQKVAAKALAKEQEKLQKALEKAEAKRLKQIEKERVKAEAKAKRELAKKEKLEKTNQDLSLREAVQHVPAQSTEVSAEVDLGMVLSPLEELECTSTSTEIQQKDISGLLGTMDQKATRPTVFPTPSTISSQSPITKPQEMQPIESTTSTEELTSVSSTPPKQNLLQYEEEPEYKPIALPQES